MSECCCTIRPVVATLLIGLFGCSASSEWEVTVENKSNAPCSVYVTMRPDGSSQASVSNLAAGTTRKLVGGSVDSVIKTVRVVHGTDEHNDSPDLKITGGDRYRIIVNPDGTVMQSFEGG